MGQDYVHVSVAASLSRHNSEQDRLDDAAWEELYRRLIALCAEPQFEGIRAWVV